MFAQLNTGIQNAVVLNAQSQSDFTDSWRNWQNTADPNAPPAYYYVYAWNLTNSEDVLAKGAKPNLVQVGEWQFFTRHSSHVDRSISARDDIQRAPPGSLVTDQFSVCCVHRSVRVPLRSEPLQRHVADLPEPPLHEVPRVVSRELARALAAVTPVLTRCSAVVAVAMVRAQAVLGVLA